MQSSFPENIITAPNPMEACAIGAANYESVKLCSRDDKIATLTMEKAEDEKINPEEVETSDGHISLVNQYIVQRDQFDAQAKTWEKLLASSNKLLKKAEAKYTELTRKELEGSKKKL